MSEATEAKQCAGKHFDWIGRETQCPHAVTHGEYCIFHAPAELKKHEEMMAALEVVVAKWIEEDHDEWNFSGFVFGGGVSAMQFTNKETDQNEPLFERSVNFGWAQFKNADFGSAQFSGYAYFGWAQFSGNANFGWAQFKNANFGWAQFKNANFGWAQFNGAAYFRSAQFSETANFGSAQFKNADFGWAQFSGYAYFGSAQFSGYAGFSSAQFSGDAVFESSQFREGLQLALSGFKSDSNFANCVVQGELILDECVLRRAFDLSGATFAGSAKFSWWGLRSEYGEAAILLRDIRFAPALEGKTEPCLLLTDGSRGDQCRVVMENCPEMRRVRLGAVDATRFVFKNCTWPTTDDRFFRKFPSERTICGDEADLTEAATEADFARVRETYQQLSKRFREDLNFPLAVEFDRGAFEMRRKELWKRTGLANWSTRAWLTLYKYGSHYSGNLLLPVGWLVLSLFVFAGGYYAFAWRGEIVGYWQALSASIGIAMIGHDIEVLESTVLHPPIVFVLKGLQKVLTVTLLAMFVFAMRRRMKH